jgi:fatty-acyl-CoA synthase
LRESRQKQAARESDAMGIFTRVQRELDLISGLQRTLKWSEGIGPDEPRTVADDIEATVDKFPANPAIWFEGEEWSYARFDARCNQFAHWALEQGLKRGDVAALLLTNRPDFIACWVGLAKVGVVTALINTNLTGGPLAHCVRVAGAKAVIVGDDTEDAYLAVAAQIEAQPAIWSLNSAGGDGVQKLLNALTQQPDSRPDPSLRAGMKGADLALYVYTSGTTGAPKAAKMPHWRVMGMMRAFIGGGRGVSTDRVYITLPLYHGTGGLCGVGFALETGACIILRKKFSASQFWDEAARERATVFFYIGELCRYLVNAPKSPQEQAHKIRLAVGNGLRPDVWQEFQPRFRIPKILEFYGSTEGNVSFLNFDGKAGAVGRIPSYLKKQLNVRVVKFDVETEAPVRGPDALCIEADADEIGEAIGEIRTDQARFRFEGYNGDPKQTEKKILRDVFVKGDAWFRTGDLMRQDKDGYFYFIDRIGDTFRWKGENVSTNEVGDVIAQFPGVLEANVYGVKVGKLDGRAGMAALTLADDAEVGALRARVHAALPAYARPVFVRLQRQIETTGTFKYRKVDLVDVGFDPAKTEDPLYFDHPEQGRYVEITPSLHDEIVAGKYRL